MKKILLLVMMLVVLLSVFAIEVSAEYYLKEEFTEDLSGLSKSTGGTWVDGALQVGPSADCVINATSSPLPKNLTVLFDYKLSAETTSTARPTIGVYTGSHRAWISPQLEGLRVNRPGEETATVTDFYNNFVSTADTWYSVMFRFKILSDGSAAYDIYRKEQGSDQPYQRYVIDARTYGNSDPACFKIDGVNASVDNIMFYEGSFASDTGIEFDGTPIDSVASIGNGTLKASTKLVSDKIVLEGDILVPGNVTPVLVFYNKNGRMISCTYVEKSVIFGENEVEIEVDTSSFYNKLDGGYGAVYFIDDFDNLQLLADKIELK